MNDKVFIDTSILLYARDAGEPAKQPNRPMRFVASLNVTGFIPAPVNVSAPIWGSSPIYAPPIVVYI